DVSIDGWIESLNPGAQGLLGIEPGSEEPRHFTDFVVPGAVEDAMTLFEIVRTTGALEATVVLQPTTGDAIAADVRVTASDRGMTGLLRLAQDVEAPASVAGPTLPESIEFLPSTDAAFRAYAERALTRMPEPTPEGLAL